MSYYSKILIAKQMILMNKILSSTNNSIGCKGLDATKYTKYKYSCFFAGKNYNNIKKWKLLIL